MRTYNIPVADCNFVRAGKLNRKPHMIVMVDVEYISFAVHVNEEVVHYKSIKSPTEVRRWIQGYDFSGEGKPIAFDIPCEIPESWAHVLGKEAVMADATNKRPDGGPVDGYSGKAS